MASSPAQQSPDDDWYDDPAIDGGDELLRVVKTGHHVVLREDGTYIVSPQVWTSQGKGCSVELRSMHETAGESVDARIDANRGFGAVSISVGDLRATMNRKGVLGDKNKLHEPLCVAHTPIPADQPFGPNPYHCDIFPKLGNPGRNTLTAKHTTLHLDQETAAAKYAATR